MVYSEGNGCKQPPMYSALNVFMMCCCRCQILELSWCRLPWGFEHILSKITIRFEKEKILKSGLCKRTSSENLPVCFVRGPTDICPIYYFGCCGVTTFTAAVTA
jgi:hypothetical protein